MSDLSRNRVDKDTIEQRFTEEYLDNILFELKLMNGYFEIFLGENLREDLEEER